jgi:hypothetical protein
MWVQATVLVILAGLGYLMVALYARAYNPAPDADEESIADGQENGPPGAPTRAQLSQLHESLRRQLGVNGRGLPRVASVNYDGWPDRLVVVFALDHDPAVATPAQMAELPPMFDVLKAVQAGGLRWRWLMLCGTGPLELAGGKAAEATVVRATFSREKLDRLEWDKLEPAAVQGLAEQFNVLLEPKAQSQPAPPADPAAAPDQSSKKST